MSLKEKFKRNKGITLIALVVTIVVLLILAGVSITMLTGQNGILNRATEAKEATRGGEVQEAVSLEAINNEQVEYLGGTKKTRAEVIEELQEKGKLTGEEVEELEENDQITIGGITIDFSVLGKTGKTLVQAFIDGEIAVGDYITNYNDTLTKKTTKIDLASEKTGFSSGTQTYSIDTTTKWRVIGLNEDKTQLMITTAEPLKKTMTTTGETWQQDPYLYLGGAEAWYWTGQVSEEKNILNQICKIYDSKYAAKTKSMGIEDLNTALKLKIKDNKLYKISDSGETEIESSSSTYVNYAGNTYTYKSGDCAPENYLKTKYSGNSEYSNLETKYIGDSVNADAYYYSTASSEIIDQESTLYNILLKGTIDSGYPKAYWLASSGVFADSSFCSFGPGVVGNGIAGSGGSSLFYSYGDAGEVGLAVCPVVYLQSNVTVKDLTTEKGSEPDESKWTWSMPDTTQKSITEGAVTEKTN